MLASLARARADVVHLQWLALPQADVTCAFASPSVFTAHDLLPRRTAGKHDLWRRLLGRFDASSSIASAAATTLAELGVDARVIPHPVYPSTATRGDDGHTLLSLGVIRPYKGLADAIETTRRLPESRLLVAGDPAMPLDGLRDARTRRVAARLPTSARARPRALGDDRRRLSLPSRARPVGCAAAGARRRRPRGRLRRRWARRAGPRVTAPAPSCRAGTSTR